MKKILITGVAGFLGRAIARYFSQRGDVLFGIDRLAVENAPVSDLSKYATLELPDARLSDFLEKWQPEVCVHCAGRASVSQSMKKPAEDYEAGPALTFYLLDTLRRVSQGSKFIFLSSAAVYGEPTSLPVSEKQFPAPVSAYGYHKWQGEILCQEFARLFGLKTASIRIFSAYGPGLRRQVIWDIARKALTQPKLILQGTGEESRDFIHAVDIAGALEAVVSSAPLTGEVYNVASGRETTIAALAKMVLAAMDLDVALNFSGNVPPGTPKNWRADISRIQNLGFAPQVSLEDGIESFAAWCRREILGV